MVKEGTKKKAPGLTRIRELRAAEDAAQRSAEELGLQVVGVDELHESNAEEVLKQLNPVEAGTLKTGIGRKILHGPKDDSKGKRQKGSKAA